VNFLPGLASTWTVFLSPIGHATHILVLGHSLFDEHLLTAVREWDGKHLAYFLYREPHEKYGYAALPNEGEQQYWNARLGREITLIPDKFGGQDSKDDDFLVTDLREWASRDP
jgi:hypothetical protein